MQRNFASFLKGYDLSILCSKMHEAVFSTGDKSWLDSLWLKQEEVESHHYDTQRMKSLFLYLYCKVDGVFIQLMLASRAAGRFSEKMGNIFE